MKNQSYAVFGLGRYGLATAKELAAAGAQVLAVDRDEQAVQSAAAMLIKASLMRGSFTRRKISMSSFCISSLILPPPPLFFIQVNLRPLHGVEERVRQSMAVVARPTYNLCKKRSRSLMAPGSAT